MAADIKDISRQLFEEPWKGNFDVIDRYVDASYTGYDPTEPDAVRGPQGFKNQIQQYLTAFPDARLTVDEQFIDGDVVATRWTGRGTHQGDLMGIAPTGRQVTIWGLTIEKYKNGKLVEGWNNWDALGMLQQVGAIPAMATA
jgi:predicted ester cyclase